MKKLFLATSLAAALLGVWAQPTLAAVRNAPLDASVMNQFVLNSVYKDLKVENQEFYFSLKSLVPHVERTHFLHPDLNSATYAARVLEQYLNRLDPAKQFFTKQDVEGFEKAFLGGSKPPIVNDLSVVYKIYQIYAIRKMEFLRMQAAILVGLTKEPNLNLDLEIPANAKDRQYRDDKSLSLQDHAYTYLVATLIDEKISRPKLNWNDIRQRVMNALTFAAKRTNDYDSNDPMRFYYNGVGLALDAHSDFLIGKDAREEFESFNSTFVGIGVGLEQEISTGGKIRITEIIEGGPVSKQGGLFQDDEIQEVSQDGKNFVDITEMNLKDAIKLIKGPKNTSVWLRVLRPDGTLATVKIDRGTVVQSFAAKINTFKRGDKTYGVLKFDTFYTNLDDDVRKLIKANPNLDGLIVDLRQNGGGQVHELLGLADIFLPTFTPVYQQTNSEFELKGAVKPARPTTGNYINVKFNKPVLVLTSRQSASATEIFAAAIQDNARGYIVGSTTFGKGTVQSYQEFTGFKDSDMGKLTIQKFFRIDGSTTQFKGVEPDIALPSIFSKNLGEANLPNPLSYSLIEKTKFTPLKSFVSPNFLKELTKTRDAYAASNKEYADYVKAITQNVEYASQKTLKLNYVMQKQQRDSWRNYQLKAYNAHAKLNGFPTYDSYDNFIKHVKVANLPDPYLDLGKELLVKYVDIWAKGEK